MRWHLEEVGVPDFTQPDFQQLYSAVYSALRNWHKSKAEHFAILEQLQLLRDQGFCDPVLEPEQRRTIVNAILQDGIQQLQGSQALGASILQRRFVDGDIILKVANRLNISQDQVNRLQRQAIKDLTQLLIGREQALRARKSLAMLSELPLEGHGSFFDPNRQAHDLLNWASEPAPPFVLALTGLSGTGKTRLASEVARRLVPDFRYDQVLWAFAQPSLHSDGQHQLLPRLAHKVLAPPASPSQRVVGRLRSFLSEYVCLVIIDEAQLDLVDDAELETLAALGGPSRFVLLSHTLPASLEGVQVQPLKEWPLDTAIGLLTRHIRHAGLELAGAKLERLASDMCALVGGHPAALKLVANLLSALPPSAVDQAFRTEAHNRVEALYRRVYQHARQSVSEPAWQLLQALAAQESSDHSHQAVLALNHLSQAKTNAALWELHRYSLVQRAGTLTEPIYRLARLTITFLHSEYANLL